MVAGKAKGKQKKTVFSDVSHISNDNVGFAMTLRQKKFQPGDEDEPVRHVKSIRCKNKTCVRNEEYYVELFDERDDMKEKFTNTQIFLEEAGSLYSEIQKESEILKERQQDLKKSLLQESKREEKLISEINVGLRDKRALENKIMQLEMDLVRLSRPPPETEKEDDKMFHIDSDLVFQKNELDVRRGLYVHDGVWKESSLNKRNAASWTCCMSPVKNSPPCLLKKKIKCPPVFPGVPFNHAMFAKDISNRPLSAPSCLNVFKDSSPSSIIRRSGHFDLEKRRLFELENIHPKYHNPLVWKRSKPKDERPEVDEDKFALPFLGIDNGNQHNDKKNNDKKNNVIIRSHYKKTGAIQVFQKKDGQRISIFPCRGLSKLDSYHVQKKM